MGDYTEKRLTAVEVSQLEMEHRIAELERKDALTASCLARLSQRINELESRQPAPEPVVRGDGLQQAIKAAGSQRELADLVGVVEMTVSHWKTRGVPAEQVLPIERVTGVPRHLIRPDLYPDPPIDRELGRQLVGLLRERKLSASTMRHRLKLASDWIQSVCGEARDE